MSVNEVFSRHLLVYRTSNKLTQQQMAELCGVSVRHYQNLEIGRSLPSLTNAVKISVITNFSLDSLQTEVISNSEPASIN